MRGVGRLGASNGGRSGEHRRGAGAANGDALYRRATFLADRRYEAIASPLLTLFDDGALSGRLGSRPFDGEGVTTPRADRCGVFQGFLFDTYNARRLDTVSTGSAWRSVGGLPQVGSGNLANEAGTASPEQIIADVADGFYLTTLRGFGINYTTGDFSRGGHLDSPRRAGRAGSGDQCFGQLARLEMFERIDAVGDDDQWFGAIASPTLRTSRMTVSGT